ncbi:unnamed protein product [Lupinus luteus]|uniref:Uncharacterized protein n=1 Tax=Lupinus luteus TaxID=3873 RepID=A0AAV1WBC9_LUPLU
MVVTRRVNHGLQWNGPRYASLFPEHRSMSVSFSQWQLLSPTTTFGKCGVIDSTSTEVKDSDNALAYTYILLCTSYDMTFIALKSIHEHKHDLQALVTSKDFIGSRYYRDKKANRFVEVMMNTRFWNDCTIIVNIVAPLIRLLRIVDADERPSLPYVYDGMPRARKNIKNVFMNKKSLYKPYTRIIKQRWDKQLRTKLHCAAYFLNPTFYYDKDNFCIRFSKVGLMFYKQKLPQAKLSISNKVASIMIKLEVLAIQ